MKVLKILGAITVTLLGAIMGFVLFWEALFGGIRKNVTFADLIREFKNSCQSLLKPGHDGYDESDLEA